MYEAAVSQYITTTFAGVETTIHSIYDFFFYGPDRKLPFATLVATDNEYDNLSNLDRPGIFRLNLGVSKRTFESLFVTTEVDLSTYDFTALDTVMPHPEYARQSWVCVLNPSDETFQKAVQPLILEAYNIVVKRHARRHPAENPQEAG